MRNTGRPHRGAGSPSLIIAGVTLAVALTACGGNVSPNADTSDVATVPTPSASPTPSATATPTVSATATTAATPTATASPAPNGTKEPGPPPTPAATDEPTGELVITQDDSGRTYTFDRDTQAVLRLHPDRGTWSDPQLDGDVLELAERQFIVDPGYREWEIRVVGRGTDRISSTSDPCPNAQPPCGAPSFLFEVTINVP